MAADAIQARAHDAMGVGRAVAGVGPAQPKKRQPCALSLCHRVALSSHRSLAQDRAPDAALARGGAGGQAAGPEADRLAERIRAYFGAEALLKGAAAPKIDESDRRLGGRASAASGWTRRPRAWSPTPCTSRCRWCKSAGGLYAGVATSRTATRSRGTSRPPIAVSAAGSSRSTRRTRTAARSRACRRARRSRCRRGRARSSRARSATGGSTSRRSTGPRPRPR